MDCPAGLATIANAALSVVQVKANKCPTDVLRCGICVGFVTWCENVQSIATRVQKWIGSVRLRTD